MEERDDLTLFDIRLQKKLGSEFIVIGRHIYLSKKKLQFGQIWIACYRYVLTNLRY